jgi:hypothetical protein
MCFVWVVWSVCVDGADFLRASSSSSSNEGTVVTFICALCRGTAGSPTWQQQHLRKPTATLSRVRCGTAAVYVLVCICFFAWVVWSACADVVI